MEIITDKNTCIITPLSPVMSLRETDKLENEILNNINKNIGIDLSFVNDFSFEFIETIKNFNVSLFNIPSDLFALINAMNLDKNIQLYVSEIDFLDQKNRLINRKFSLIN